MILVSIERIERKRIMMGNLESQFQPSLGT